MAVDHERIAQLLGEEGATSDTSLRAQSLQRATAATPPKTLTPYEWQQWYAEHGVPASHTPHKRADKRPWWRALFSRRT